MWRERIRALVRRAIADPRRGELGLYAANGAYYLFLSLGPLTALLLAVLPYTPVSESQLLDGALRFAPAAFRRLVRAVVGDLYARPAAALSMSLVLELWSGARFLASVFRGVGAITGGGGGGYFRRRLMGALFTGMLVLFVLGNLGLTLFGEWLLLTVRTRYPGAEGLWSAVLRLRAPLFLAGLTAGIALLYRQASASGGPPRRYVPGAALAAGGWLLFSRGYSLVLDRFGLFGVYGSIAAVLASLYWAYISLYILFAGAWLNDLAREDSYK